MLASDGVPTHVDWVLAEASTEVLTALLATLWQDTHPLVADLLSMVRHSTRELWAQVDFAAEYELLPMNSLRYLSLNLNTWFISVDKNGEDIDLPSMSAIKFDLDRRTFDRTDKPSTLFYTPPSWAPTKTSTWDSPSLLPATIQHQEMCTGRALRKPPAYLLLTNVIGLHRYMYKFQHAGKQLPYLLEYVWPFMDICVTANVS